MVEVVGNRLPHPVTIFIMLSVAVIIISEIASRAGVSVTYYDAKAKKDAVVGAVSLMNAEGLHYMFTHATSNFTGFAPLGTVLVAMLGVGVAEGTGLIALPLNVLYSAHQNVLLPQLWYLRVLCQMLHQMQAM